jgi:hypothetical protein
MRWKRVCWRLSNPATIPRCELMQSSISNGSCAAESLPIFAIKKQRPPSQAASPKTF